MPQLSAYQAFHQINMSKMNTEELKAEVLTIQKDFASLYEKLLILAADDDLEVAQIGGCYLEKVTRAAIDKLYEVADQRPEILAPWARQRLDWPGFIPEHVAAKKANERMLKLIQLGKASPIDLSGSNLDRETLSVALEMMRAIQESRANYYKDVQLRANDEIPAWRHDAQELDNLNQGSKSAWFKVGWHALEHGRGGRESLLQDQLILGIVGDSAMLRAEGRKHQKIAKLKSQLKLAEASETDAESLRLEMKIWDAEREEAKVADSDILERAKTKLKSAFYGLVGNS